MCVLRIWSTVYFVSRLFTGPVRFSAIQGSVLSDSSPITPEPLYLFKSQAHPGDATAQVVYGRALVRPLGVCMVPIMIGSLVTVLQGLPALTYLTVGFPAALLLAVLWTLFQMQATVVEIFVRPGAAAVRTVWESLRARPLRWMPIFELREASTTLTLALGDTTYELDRAAWPDADALLDTLKAARAIRAS